MKKKYNQIKLFVIEIAILWPKVLTLQKNKLILTLKLQIYEIN